MRRIFSLLAGLAFVFFALPYIGDGFSTQIHDFSANLGVSEFVFKLLLSILCALIIALIVHFLKGIGIVATIITIAIILFTPSSTPGFHPVEKFNQAAANFQSFWSETEGKLNIPNDKPDKL